MIRWSLRLMHSQRGNALLDITSITSHGCTKRNVCEKVVIESIRNQHCQSEKFLALTGELFCILQKLCYRINLTYDAAANELLTPYL